MEHLAAVRRVGDEPSYLYRIVETIGSGPDLETILQGVVLLLTEATACNACLIWFVQEDRLVLRAASPPYQRLAGLEMAADEGLAGWVVRTRRSAFIEENALSDPRVRYFAELDEERFQSLVSVPIFAREGTVIGVIALDAEAPHEFSGSDLDFLEHTASLIGGAAENARLYEDATARVSTLWTLSRLSQAIASAPTEADVLRVVTEGLHDLLSADRSEIHLVGLDGRLMLSCAKPERRAPASIDASRAWRLASDTSQAGEGRAGLARALWSDEPAGSSVFAPVVAGEENLGLLAVTLPSRTLDAGPVLAAVAAHTAVALKQHRAIDRLTEENLLKDLFRALTDPETLPSGAVETASRLGCDLDLPHVVLHAIPFHGSSARNPMEAAGMVAWSETVRGVASRLHARFPGALIDGLERSLRALVPVGDASPEDVGAQIRGMDWRTTGDGLSVGLSHAGGTSSSFARGFDQAESAAEVGGLLRGSPGTTSYEELGPYRYLLRAGDDGRDALQARLNLLVEYDRRRGARLLDTLEGYLDHQSHVAAASRALFIHANTLRQRLERIERVSGIDLGQADWLSLAIATKVVKLRRMRGSVRPEGGRDG